MSTTTEPTKADLLVRQGPLTGGLWYTHYGLEICAYNHGCALTDGHVEPRRFVAALNRLQRKERHELGSLAGYFDAPDGPYAAVLANVRHCWRTVLTEDSEVDCGPTIRLDSRELARLISYGDAGDWVITFDEKPGSTPVTVWNADWFPCLPRGVLGRKDQ